MKFGNSPSMIKAPTRDQESQLAALGQRCASARSLAVNRRKELFHLMAEWERNVHVSSVADWPIDRGEVAHLRFDNAGAAAPSVVADQFENGNPEYAAGRIGEAAAFDGARFVNAGDVAGFGYFDKFSLAAWIYPRGEAGG